MDERNPESLYVCEHCLWAIESREGHQKANIIYINDEENEAESRCDWCEEHGFNILYEI